VRTYKTAALILLSCMTACNSAKTSDLTQASIQAVLNSGGNGDQLQTFYARVGWKSPWSGRNVAALREALASRARHGLNHINFPDPPNAGVEPAKLDIARTSAALAYARALSQGFVDPHALHEVYTIPRPQADLVAGLAQALQQGKLGQWLDGLAPQDADYRILSKAYQDDEREASNTAQPKISDVGGTIKAGDADPRISDIAPQLVANGYLESAPRGGDQDKYSQKIVGAVKQFQRDFGIMDDGVIGPDTLEAINMGPAARARATAVALERLRWLARDPAPTRIDVNIAAAELSYWREDKLVDQRKAIVGQPGKETPQLLAPMFRLVANPTWTIPRSIQNGQLAGKSAAYLRAHNMAWHDGWIVQESGPRNSLGLVKFDLQDDQEIYLHDTDARSLFARSQRQLSHGCVRVYDALGFAAMIAQHEGIADQWKEARDTGKQQFVKLPRPIPVRLLYHTAYVGAQGEVQVRTDPYGWDDALSEKLGFGKRTLAQFKANADDVGP
jgi:murein L,D-transpeptidase YcbB/YkuD